MKALLDFLPMGIFFITYIFSKNLLLATSVLMIAICISIALNFYLFKKVEKMLWISALIILIFGGASLLFHNTGFIQAKTSIFGLAMALALFISHYVGQRRPLIQRLLNQQLPLNDSDWKKVSWMWIVFFLAEALLNYFVWKYFSEETWVIFKVWGLLSMTLLFSVIQGIFIYKRLSSEEN